MRVAAALRPLRSSQIASLTPRRLRRAGERRNAVRKVPASDAPQAAPLAAAPVVDRHRDGDRDRDDAPGLAPLRTGRVPPQIRPVALQRAVEEVAALVVDPAAQPRDLAPGEARHPHGLRRVVDRAGRHALDAGLPDHRSQRLLRHPARFREAGAVAPLAPLRALQLDRAGPRLPDPVAVAVALRDPGRRTLAGRGPGKALDLKRHRTLDREGDRLAKQVRLGTLRQQRPQGHHVVGGHRGLPPVGWTIQAQP